MSSMLIFVGICAVGGVMETQEATLRKVGLLEETQPLRDRVGQIENTRDSPRWCEPGAGFARLMVKFG